MPVWKYKIMLSDVFHNETMTLPEIRDTIVKRIRRSRWFKDQEEHSDLEVLLDDLAKSTSAAEFDDTWNEIYELANDERAWIDTMSPM